jgi:hypothetical protein
MWVDNTGSNQPARFLNDILGTLAKVHAFRIYEVVMKVSLVTTMPFNRFGATHRVVGPGLHQVGR